MATTSRKATAAERQIKLALYVQAHGPVTRAQIQERLPEYAAVNCSEASARRRFERDKADLAAMGIVIESPNREHYVMARADEQAFSQLEAGSPQASLLRVAGTALLQDPAYPHATSLRMALAKLSGPLEIPDALNWATGESLGALRSTEPVSDGTRRKVQSALSALKLLSFDYVDAAGNESERRVEPIALFASKGREYLAAWDLNRNAMRSFRLDRMSKLSVNDNGRGKPDFEPRDFNPQDWQLLPFQMGGESAIRAEVRFQQGAQWQAHNLCAGHGSIQQHEDGSATWHVSCSNDIELAAWCIANGPGIIPAEPQEAVDAYRRLVEEARTWSAKGEAAPRSTEPTSGDADCFDMVSQSSSQELIAFAVELEGLCTANEAQEAEAGAALSDTNVLVAVLALLEQAGALSIPQTAQLLNVSESAVYQALETLAFCYDAAAEERLDLGEEGCSFAILPHPIGIPIILTTAEIHAIASAALGFTTDEIARIVTAACGDDTRQLIRISYWKEGAEGPQARIVEPQTLLVREDHAYLQAICHSSNGQRLFRLDRIIAAEVVEGAVEDLSREEIAVQNATVKAIVSLAPATRVPGWPGLMRSRKPSTDGTVTFTIPWHGGPWLPKHLASLGANVVRIEPSELAAATGDYARSL